MSKGYLGYSAFDDDGDYFDIEGNYNYKNATIKGYVDSLNNSIHANSISLLSLNDYMANKDKIDSYTLRENDIDIMWWLQDIGEDPDFGDPVILYVYGNEIMYDMVADVHNSYGNTQVAIRPTVTITIPTQNTNS